MGDKSMTHSFTRKTTIKDTDDCFIMCFYPNCFPEHDFEEIIERVQMCKILKEQSIFGEANWD